MEHNNAVPQEDNWLPENLTTEDLKKRIEAETKHEEEQVEAFRKQIALEDEGIKLEKPELQKEVIEFPKEGTELEKERIRLGEIESRHGREQRKEIARKLVENGLVLRARHTEQYAGRGSIITNIIELETFEKKVEPQINVWYQVILKPNQKYPMGLVCIDIDHPETWGMVMKMVQEDIPELNGAIINPTIKGGHIIFQANQIEKRKNKVPLNIGIESDYLTDSVTVLGPEKYILKIPNGEFILPYIPRAFQKRIPQKFPAIITNSPILEGHRNNTIFKWINGCLKCDSATKKSIACLMGRYFCDPPLDNAESILTVKETNQELEDLNSMTQNEITTLQVTQDITLIKGELENKFAYDPKINQFYKFIETHWTPIYETSFTYEIEKILFALAKEIKSPMKPTTTLAMAKTHLARAKSYLIVPQEWLDFPKGINWKNGFLVLKTREILPHIYSRWVMEVSDTSYNPNELVSYETQKTIVQCCGGNIHYINALLTCGARSLTPMPDLHTGYYFSGPSGSGKTLWSSLFLTFNKGKSTACEVTDIEKAFTRSEIVNKDLLVFNEFIKLNVRNEKYFKSLLGRDEQTSEVKHVQGYSSQVFEGIIILVSNLGPNLTYGSSTALNDRFIPIEFAPRLGKVDPLLFKKIIRNLSGIINLLLSMDPEIFPNLTRAGLINREATYDTNILVPFITKKLCFDPEGQISIKALIEGYKEWLLLTNHKNDEYVFDLAIDISTICLSLFNKSLVSTRRLHFGRKTTVLLGIRWREANDPIQEIGDTSFVMTNDIWGSLRKKTEGPFYEVKDYYSDLKKANNKNAHGNALIIDKPKITTTEIVQKQYLDEAPNNQKHKKKGKIKSELIFAASTFPQYIIPGKLSDKQLGVTKLTNKTEKDKYLYQDLPISNSQNLLDKFKDAHNLFVKKVGEPLKKAVIEGEFQYHPHVCFNQTETVRKRISHLSLLGCVSNYYEKLLGGSKILWCNSLEAAQVKHPLIEEKVAAKQNLFQTKKNFTGNLFPSYYYWNNSASPRLNSYPGHTARDSHKFFREELFVNFRKHSGTHLYDCDLSSCHPRVIMLFLSQKQAPLLYKSFSDKDLYMEIALNLKRSCPALKVFSDKLLRKIIKIKCLSLLNGGGIYTESHINVFVEIIYKKDSQDYKSIMIILVAQLGELAIVDEFKSHGNFICSRDEVFILSHSNKITSSESSHILSSPCMCSVETLAMTYLVEYIAYCPFMILPLFLIHDGLVFASSKNLSKNELNSFNLGFSKFVEEKINIPLPIETKAVGED